MYDLVQEGWAGVKQIVFINAIVATGKTDM
jgi:hypothetical protein